MSVDPQLLRASNGLRTRSLFVDVLKKGFASIEEQDNAIYWLDYKMDVKDKRPSIREHYIVCMDPTGYETAIKYFNTYDHWDYMYKNCTWFKESVDTWKTEIQAKMKSRALKVIQEIANNPEDKQALAASKYLANAEYDKVDNRGRPSAEVVKGKLKEAIQIADADREDMERIGLRLIKK